MAFDVRWMDRKFYGVELMNAKTLHVYRVIFRMDEMIFIIIYSFYFIFLFFSNTHDNRMKINLTNGNTQIHRILCWGFYICFKRFSFFFLLSLGVNVSVRRASRRAFMLWVRFVDSVVKNRLPI